MPDPSKTARSPVLDYLLEKKLIHGGRSGAVAADQAGGGERLRGGPGEHRGKSEARSNP